MAGRKSKLTKEIISRLSNLIAQGATNKDACAIVGVSEALFYNWMSWAIYIDSNGSEGSKKTANVSDKLLIEFLESVERAKSNSYVISINEIRRAGSPAWRHIRTGRMIYREPSAITWQNKYTGETIFTTPPDTNNWERQLSGEVWEYTPGKWQAQAWYLERSDKDNWGNNVDITGSLEPVEFIITKADDETSQNQAL